ncbi:hypothetical protein F5X68DRAFT_239214 [Plectosphaerella plurivora]|uniref:Zn(2)-C6 fungal-type domain-containing protein n=1 Tax=Plectosphaerella plurivora TaxID=936078 RepID=A0A9P9ABB6_9PEZI|nr:hypothetical protein F5X68DRAFT_239214 [Plectosphaerella plurivora]
MDDTSVSQLPKRLNNLSCASCKSRKIRCNRVQPICDGCFARKLACVYPLRKRRTPAPESPAQSIHRRLLRLEKRCTDLVPVVASRRESARASETARSNLSAPVATVADAKEAQVAIDLTTPPHSDSRDQLEAVETGATTGRPAVQIGIEERLNRAMDETLQLKRRSLDNKATTLISRIPTQLCKTYIDQFCMQYRGDIFPDFINIKLIYLINDLIDIPVTGIHPATIMLYHSILYHGSLMMPSDPQDENPTQAMYVRCLHAIPAWKEQVTGTKTDLITAILLMRAALQQCDYAFSWSMYRLVCFCMKTLNLHILDKDFPLPFLDPTTNPVDGAEQFRQGFWALVLVDLFFRLLHERPAVITSNVSAWRVNLPSLRITPEVPALVAPTLAFIVGSRLSFHLLRFFDVLGQYAEDVSSAVASIEGLCAEIESLFHEWPVDDIMAENEGSQASWWALYEVAVTAHCSIMVMSHGSSFQGQPLRQTDMDDTPPSPLSVTTARRILQLASLGLEKYPIPPTASFLWGANRCYVAYGCLAQYLLGSDPAELVSTWSTDVALLEHVAKATAATTEMDCEFKPLVQALSEVNAEIKAHQENA